MVVLAVQAAREAAVMRIVLGRIDAADSPQSIV